MLVGPEHRAHRKMLVGLELRTTIVERALHRVRDSRRMRALEIRENVLASRMLSPEISNRAPERKTTFRVREMFRGREHRKTEMRDPKMGMRSPATETRDRKLRLVRGHRRMRLHSEDNRHRVPARRTIILRLAG